MLKPPPDKPWWEYVAEQNQAVEERRMERMVGLMNDGSLTREQAVRMLDAPPAVAYTMVPASFIRTLATCNAHVASDSNVTASNVISNEIGSILTYHPQQQRPDPVGEEALRQAMAMAQTMPKPDESLPIETCALCSSRIWSPERTGALCDECAGPLGQRVYRLREPLWLRLARWIVR